MNIKKLTVFTLVFLLSLLSFNMVSATLNVSLSDQGTEVTTTSSGALLTVGDLTVLIYDALTGGNLIYNETFSSAIGNGSWNVMLGETTNLPLEFGKIYFKDYLIAGEDANFTNGTGQTVGRKFFYSPLGDINSSKIFGVFTGASNSTNGTTGIVPKPQAGEQGECLKGDGTWGACQTGNASTFIGYADSLSIDVDASPKTMDHFDDMTRYDPDNWYVNATSLVVPSGKGGWYTVGIQMENSGGTGAGDLRTGINLNGVNYFFGNDDSTGAIESIGTIAIFELSVGDIIGWLTDSDTGLSAETYDTIRFWVDSMGGAGTGGGGAELTGVFGTGTGTVFSAGSTFIMTFDSVTGDVSDWTTDNNSFIVPAGKSGTYAITYSVSTSGSSAGAEFTVIPTVDGLSRGAHADNVDSGAMGNRQVSTGAVMELTEGQNITFKVFIGGTTAQTVVLARMGIKEIASTGGAIWSVNSTDDSIYYTAGNVGIGTSSPDATLEVNGNLHITSIEGTWGGGEAYVCVYDNGTIFAKDSSCN